MDDPRLTPARPDLAAKYLEGKVKAARFVEGEEFEVVDASRAAAREPSLDAMLRDAGAEGRARHDLRSQRRRLGLGPVERRRLCRLAAGRRAGKACGCTDAQGHGAADVRVSRALDQAAAGRDAVDGREADDRCARTAASPSPTTASTCRAACRAARRDARRISSRSPNASSARPICGAARAALGIDCSGLVQVSLDAAGIGCPRDSDMQQAGLGRALTSS